MLTCLFALVNPNSVGQQVLAVVFLTSVLLSTPDCLLQLSFVHWSLLLPSADCVLLLLTDLSCRLSSSADCFLLASLGPSFSRLLPVSLTCPLCGFRAKTKGSSDWHPRTPTQRMLNIVSHPLSQTFFLSPSLTHFPPPFSGIFSVSFSLILLPLFSHNFLSFSHTFSSLFLHHFSLSFSHIFLSLSHTFSSVFITHFPSPYHTFSFLFLTHFFYLLLRNFPPFFLTHFLPLFSDIFSPLSHTYFLSLSHFPPFFSNFSSSFLKHFSRSSS